MIVKKFQIDLNANKVLKAASLNGRLWSSDTGDAARWSWRHGLARATAAKRAAVVRVP